MKKKILCVVGTRPEVIKMAPVISALKSQDWADVRVVATAQHREMLDQMLDLFEIKPDIDFNIMTPNQSLIQLNSKLLLQFDELIQNEKPHAIIAQGDTTTTFASGLAAFYQHIPFYHVEAGLRSNDIQNPFPEEMNRILTDKISTLHFAPTQASKNNLLEEGLSPESIFVTGNTVIDSLFYISNLHIEHQIPINPNKRLILVTAHRRENFGKPFLEICSGLRKIADQFDDLEIIFPVHPNPNIQKCAFEELNHHPNIKLVPPLDYPVLISLIKQSYFILTDSGGLQEEAPAFSKPVLVLRETTERMEGIDAGIAKLVPLDSHEIYKYAADLLESKENYQAMAKPVMPYGDGTAGLQILGILKDKFLVF